MSCTVTEPDPLKSALRPLQGGAAWPVQVANQAVRKSKMSWTVTAPSPLKSPGAVVVNVELAGVDGMLPEALIATTLQLAGVQLPRTPVGTAMLVEEVVSTVVDPPDGVMETWYDVAPDADAHDSINWAA